MWNWMWSMLTISMWSEYLVNFLGQYTYTFTSPFKFLIETDGGLLSIFTAGLIILSLWLRQYIKP